MCLLHRLKSAETSIAAPPREEMTERDTSISFVESIPALLYAQCPHSRLRLHRPLSPLQSSSYGISSFQKLSNLTPSPAAAVGRMPLASLAHSSRVPLSVSLLASPSGVLSLPRRCERSVQPLPPPLPSHPIPAK